MQEELFGAGPAQAAATAPAPTRRCTTCERTPGLYVSQAFRGSDGRDYPERRSPCHTCGGRPDVPRPDFRALVVACKGRKGLRSARPDDRLAYYVWRMARFHGGADVTMPMTASMDLGRHPWRPELDKLADLVARRVYGTDLAGAHRWGRALGQVGSDLPGLPDSAYSGGRVHDGNKPLEELAELV